jgi:dihydroorotase
MTTTLIRNVTIINERKKFKGSVLIKGNFISDIYESGKEPSNLSPVSIINGENKILIPGIIDDHVHFRQPGYTHKADIYTETKAAVAGGVTSYMEMPNTNPQTVSQGLLEQKYIAGERFSLANYSFYMGATNDNLCELLKTDPRNVCGIKLFMGSSTGNMLVDDPTVLEQIFKESKILIAAHCEDEGLIKANLDQCVQKYHEDIPMSCHSFIRSGEACYLSTAKAVALATKHGTRLHVLHLSTTRETELFSSSTPLNDKKITSEVCMPHLWFNESDYEKYGTLIKCNPAIKTENDRKGLLAALKNNRIDVIASDHAPHTKQEKQNKYLNAPSGGPGIQNSLVVMLELYKRGEIEIEMIVEKMCHAPAELFRIEKRGFIRQGYYADLVLIDMEKETKVDSSNTLYKCGWSPFEGINFSSSVTHTFVNGHLVNENGKVDDRYRGMRLMFDR